MPPNARVFDSWAILAFLQGEPAAAEVESLILKAEESGVGCWITAVNLGEVWYNVARRVSEAEADEKIQGILKHGFTIVDVDWDLARQAARYKARHKLSYADCFASALAKLRKAELVTGDPEFRQLDKELRIRWL